jgi:glutaredoxin
MSSRPLLIVCAVASLSGLASAQYKVTAPDGSVTYTDRPPVAATGKVTSLGRREPATPDAGAETAGLPFDLRQTAVRYPVTLYTAANCIPCDNGRQLLQQRGVPYRERQVLNADDSAALERLTGGRTIPALTVGSQPLRGFNPTDWGSYIDAAGYPAESRLPRGWQPPAPTPLVARAAPASAPAAAPPAPSPAPAAAAPADAAAPGAPGAPTLRF